MSTETVELEYCSSCDNPTGNAGRDEDSIFISLDGEEEGPLCEECYELLTYDPCWE